jgi:hypothetical protein
MCDVAQRFRRHISVTLIEVSRTESAQRCPGQGVDVPRRRAVFLEHWVKSPARDIMIEFFVPYAPFPPLLAFTSVYFSESSLFNGLWPLGVKIFFPFRGSGRNVAHPFLFAPRWQPAGSIPATGKGIARTSGFCKSNVAKSAFQTLDAGGASLAARQAPGWNAAGARRLKAVSLQLNDLRGEDP